MDNNKAINVSNEGIVANNLMYIVCDILEQLIPIAKNEFRKGGYELKKYDTIRMNEILFNAKDLRKRTVLMEQENQISFGNESDLILKLILLSIDRTGDTEKVMHQIINHVEKRKSKYNFNLKKFGI